jgi:hypothetical protein
MPPPKPAPMIMNVVPIPAKKMHALEAMWVASNVG